MNDEFFHQAKSLAERLMYLAKNLHAGIDVQEQLLMFGRIEDNPDAPLVVLKDVKALISTAYRTLNCIDAACDREIGYQKERRGNPDA